ncbi:SBE2.2, partial [Symbiodinium pilosum]
VQLSTGPTSPPSAWPFPAQELRLASREGTEAAFEASGLVRMSAPGAFQVFWEVQNGRVARGAPVKVQLPFALDSYRVHFPGTYVLDCFGNLTCGDSNDSSE